MAIFRAVIVALVLAGPSADFLEGATAQERVSFPTQDGGLVYADLYGKGERGVVLANVGDRAPTP